MVLLSFIISVIYIYIYIYICSFYVTSMHSYMVTLYDCLHVLKTDPKAFLYKMAMYKCIVILLMISLCWGSELHPATETVEIAGANQRSRLSILQEQACPTWYRETK